MSEWETIERRIGARGTGGVTVAWRTAGSKTRFVLCVTLGRPVVAALGLEADAKPRMLAQWNRSRGLLRLVQDAGQDARALSWTAGVAEIQVPLADVTSAARMAERAEYEIVDGAVIVTLPAWARPAIRVSRPAIPLVEPKPAPNTKQEAALALLRARVGTDQVVRETGLSPRDVVRLAEQVRAERSAA